MEKVKTLPQLQNERKELEGCEVVLAYLQTPTNVPGLGGGTTTLSITKTPGLKMELGFGGLLTSYKNITNLIPLANVNVAQLA